MPTACRDGPLVMSPVASAQPHPVLALALTDVREPAALPELPHPRVVLLDTELDGQAVGAGPGDGIADTYATSELDVVILAR